MAYSGSVISCPKRFPQCAIYSVSYIETERRTQNNNIHEDIRELMEGAPMRERAPVALVAHREAGEAVNAVSHCSCFLLAEPLTSRYLLGDWKPLGNEGPFQVAENLYTPKRCAGGRCLPRCISQRQLYISCLLIQC